jgi:hypothetical protein
VRTRVKRGLELLREELDRRHGDRQAWSVLSWGSGLKSARRRRSDACRRFDRDGRLKSWPVASALTLSRPGRRTQTPLPAELPPRSPPAAPSPRTRRPRGRTSGARAAAPTSPPAQARARRRDGARGARSTPRRPIEGVSMEIPGFAQHAGATRTASAPSPRPQLQQGLVQEAGLGDAHRRGSQGWVRPCGWRYRAGAGLRDHGHLEDLNGKRLGGNAPSAGPTCPS